MPEANFMRVLCTQRLSGLHQACWSGSCVQIPGKHVVKLTNFVNCVLQEGLSPIITAIQASRTIFARLQAYLIYRIASSLLILGFFFFAIIILGLEMPTWAIIVINITNDVSVMATSFDKVSPEVPFKFPLFVLTRNS